MLLPRSLPALLEEVRGVQGRASRSEFWWWVLAAFGINIVLDILNTATDEKLGFLATIWGLATLIPTLALSVRRLHDTNKPGWWVAIFYIAMVIGLIIMIIGGGAALYGGFRSLAVMTMVMAAWPPAVLARRSLVR